MSAPTPVDLRVLCRKLSSLQPTQLPHALPSLINHVLYCKEALTAPREQKTRDNSSETSQLVHKFKTTVTAFLNGRSQEARFAAIGLVKAAVDVGGWQVLSGSDPWVGGLLSIVKKADHIASKELAIVTLTGIYISVHSYQTLVREIATPTIPAFVTACLVLIKQSPSGETSKTPLSVIETICDVFSTLIPLYPTTFRPFSSQIRSATRSYVAPTQSDSIYIPKSLQRAARRVVISLHHVAAKSGGSEEWAKLVDSLLKDLHSTADQVLRAVQETWEGSCGYDRAIVYLDGEPHGGSAETDALPPWTGINDGVDRLSGLFHYLSDCLRYPTKTTVTIPTSALIDAVARVCSIARLSPKTQSWDQAVQTNPAIGREERDELFSLVPNLHEASFELIRALAQRLGQNLVPLAPEVIDHLVRVFKSGSTFCSIRTIGYSSLKDILLISGPTLSKSYVDMLPPIISACCQDLQIDAGYYKPAQKPETATSKSNKSSIAANTDLFLKNQTSAPVDIPTITPDQKAAAAALLAILPSHLPQQQLKPSLRGLVDQTAILTRNVDAMFASVLNPYKDLRGQMYPSILPHLTQQFPNYQGLEILRTNLRVPQGRTSSESALEPLPVEDENDEDEEMEEAEKEPDVAPTEEAGNLFKPGYLPTSSKALPIQTNPFESSKSAALPPKRKLDDNADDTPTKRLTVEKSRSPSPAPVLSSKPVVAQQAEEDESDDESVHLNMELEDDEDDGSMTSE